MQMLLGISLARYRMGSMHSCFVPLRVHLPVSRREFSERTASRQLPTSSPVGPCCGVMLRSFYLARLRLIAPLSLLHGNGSLLRLLLGTRISACRQKPADSQVK